MKNKLIWLIISSALVLAYFGTYFSFRTYSSSNATFKQFGFTVSTMSHMVDIPSISYYKHHTNFYPPSFEKESISEIYEMMRIIIDGNKLKTSSGKPFFIQKHDSYITMGIHITDGYYSLFSLAEHIEIFIRNTR